MASGPSRYVWLFACAVVTLIAIGMFFARCAGGNKTAQGVGENEYALPTGAALGSFGRLTAWPGKIEVPCPPMDDKTAVLLILGQSNAANHAGQRIASKYGSRVVNFHAGHCAIAESPLLGATGQGGELWTAVGTLLIESGAVTRVVLIPVAVSGTRIARWVPGGDLHLMLIEALSSLRPHYAPTHILLLQGESDFAAGTSRSAYGASLRALVRSLRSEGLRAPVYVAVASRCAGSRPWNPDNDIAAAQRAAADQSLAIRRGPDLDDNLGVSDRYDGCHLSDLGVMNAARAWVAAISPGRV